MPRAPKSITKLLLRPQTLSVLGTALVAPIPILAANPALIPGWLLNRVGGAPLLTWLLLLLMAALVGVATLCTFSIAQDE
jgi:hypothetical protein